MTLLCRIVICILPFPLPGLIHLIVPRSLVSSIIIFFFVFLAWRLLSAWQGIAGPRFGSLFGLLLGLGIGAILTVCSIIAMGVVGAYPFDLQPYPTNTLPRDLLMHTRTACIEEIFMRGGAVHFSASFFGPGWGYFAGSIPFALMHYWNPTFDFKHFVCISSAGLMLSAVYIKYGLLAAIGVHFAWNFLSRFLIYILSWYQFGGTSALEGAWTTTFIMLTATFAIIMISRRHKLAQDEAPQPFSNEESIA